MNELLTYLLSGIALGSTFALVGSGFVIVHRVTHVVNFAQGTFAVLGGLIASTLLSGILPHGVGEVVAVAITAVVGLVVGLIAIGKPGVTPQTSLVITIGLSILAYAIEIVLWGDAPRSFEGLPGRVQILGVPVQAQYLLVFGVSLVAFIVMELLFSRTYIGKALTASASNPRAARLVGIDIKKMGLISFAIAGALGGLAGVLITPLRELSYNSDMLLVLSGFAAAVFGGLNSPIKTAIGGLVLGIVGMLVAGYWNGQFQTEVALIAMLLVMIVRSRRLTAEEAR